MDLNRFDPYKHWGFELAGAATTDILDLTATLQGAKIVGLYLSPAAVITARIQLDTPVGYFEKTGLFTLETGGGFIWSPPDRGVLAPDDIWPKFLVPVGRKLQIVHSGAAGGVLWYIPFK